MTLLLQLAVKTYTEVEPKKSAFFGCCFALIFSNWPVSAQTMHQLQSVSVPAPRSVEMLCCM